MDDYISREAATQAKPEFLNENHDDAEKALYAKGWNACNSVFIDNLLNIPAADVRPVKEGHWIENCTDYICSACGGVVSDEIVYMLQSEGLPYYCPYCGVKLKGEPNG